MIGRRRLGEILRQRGLVESRLREALELQALHPGMKLGVALVRIGAVTEEDVAEALAVQLGLPYRELSETRVDPAVVWRLPREQAERHLALPLDELPDGSVEVALAEPQDRARIERLAELLGAPVRPVVASPRQLRAAIERHYGLEPVVARMLRDVPPEVRRFHRAPTSLELDAEAIRQRIREGGSRAFSDLLDLLLVNAIERGASDIHVEPRPDDLRVRYRIDGVLREVLTLPTWAQGPLIGRIKVLGGMDVAERRRPLDGRVPVRLGGRRVDLRISTLPTQHGENAVIRILDPSILDLGFPELGWPPDLLRRWYRLLSSPRGMLLVVGPTGSGKSTTLYASIQRLVSEGVSIVTVEDPVEYSLPDIAQVQVNERAGITFSSSIRALMRQDPNVIVIGEIRDPETAQAAFQAATTGHLVLSTLHTDDTVSTVTRLLDLGVPRYLLGSSLSGVVSQRLVRRLCPRCSLPAEPAREDWERLGLPPLDLGGSMRRAGPGCPHCQYMGYRGRTGVYELLELGPELAVALQAGAGEAELWRVAVEQGVRPLLRDALEKVAAGITSLEEVARVVRVDDYPPEAVQAALEPFARLADEEEPSLVELPPDVLEPLTPIEPARPPRERPLVLVVDDAEEVLELVRLSLEDDFDVIEARDGQEALERVRAEHPDLLVLDVMMPRVSGYEVTARLKEDPSTARIPVLMLSARGEKRHVKEGFRVGADDYLPKPFDPEELLLRCRALLRRSGWG